MDSIWRSVHGLSSTTRMGLGDAVAPHLRRRHLGGKVKLLQVSFVQVMHCEVVPQRWQGVPGVHRHLKLSSDLGGVDVLQLGSQLVLEEVKVVLRSVFVRHGAAQELVRVGFQGLQLHLLSIDRVGQGEDHWLGLSTLHAERSAFGGLECQAHACSLHLDLVLQLLVFPLVVVHCKVN